jgi:hypothetical protein
MTDLRNTPDSLERLIDGVLRDQPLRRAPAALEARVLARIQLLESSSWRTAGFLRWPLAARFALLVALLAIAKLTVDLVVWLFARDIPVTQTVENSVVWAKSTASLFSTMVSLGHALFDAIPSYWITLALVFSAGMYITLFVLGATAYRTLYLNK